MARGVIRRASRSCGGLRLPLEDSMSFRSPIAAVSGLLGSLSLRFGGAAVAFGLFAVSATGCGGCDEASLNCDAAGENCVICDGYGCHPADPNVTGGTGGSGGSAGTATAGTGRSSSRRTEARRPFTKAAWFRIRRKGGGPARERGGPA